MSEPVIPDKSKLFIGILTSSDELLLSAEKSLSKKYGEIDYKTQEIPFTHTDYYSSIGKYLFKVILSFKNLIKRESIVEIKIFTHKLEKKISGKRNRRINIDPGYLTLSNIYLASFKEFFHRVYLRRGVYLENEFRYVGRKYQPWEWTYPDYKKIEYIDFFHSVRTIYYKQLRK